MACVHMKYDYIFGFQTEQLYKCTRMSLTKFYTTYAACRRESHVAHRFLKS